MTRIVGRLCLPRHSAAKAGQTPISLDRHFTEWSRPESSDIDGQLIRARERERTSQTPKKNILKKVLPYQRELHKTARGKPALNRAKKKLKKVLPCERQLIKTAPDRYQLSRKQQGNNIMKLRKYSLLVAAVGALILTGFIVPKANAVVLIPIEYFNFEAAGTAVYDNGPLLSTNPFNGYTFLQGGNAITNVNFPNGGATGGLFQVETLQGTNDGALSPDDSSSGALALNGNTTGPGSSLMYCFKFSVNTTTFSELSLSFELKSIGSGGQFTGVEVFYSLNGSTFIASAEGLTPITQDGAYHPYTATLDLTGKTTNTTMIEFCFSGSTNSDTKNRTFVDNIVVNAVVPEPSTYIGGLLGIVGLCWCQRRWFTRFLRLRCA